MKWAIVYNLSWYTYINNIVFLKYWHYLWSACSCICIVCFVVVVIVGFIVVIVFIICSSCSCSCSCSFSSCSCRIMWLNWSCSCSLLMKKNPDFVVYILYMFCFSTLCFKYAQKLRYDSYVYTLLRINSTASFISSKEEAFMLINKMDINVETSSNTSIEQDYTIYFMKKVPTATCALMDR